MHPTTEVHGSAAGVSPAALNTVDISSGEGRTLEHDVLLSDLVHTHSVRLERFILKHIGNATDAQDLAQQAFVEAVRSQQHFRGESQMSTWLYGIALNLVRNYLSRAPHRRYDFVDETHLEQVEAVDARPDTALESSQTMAALQESLQELPESMREILLLVGTQEVSYEEAAAMLTVPIGTVRSRLSRARCALRKLLVERGIELDF